ncbi:CYTH domain-containing protein [Macrococcoides caseolyticum]|uniref:CYTH domain-containing protein n=1 Tax=Macrococcoides caseolyticum TaxID=69966 RepID=UPI001F1F3CF2|nr:CYTH domain-containing protein [Macrococcus caseolyticus]MCE4955723.1 CYTH domain-containing protein [Macrococcus caseolyticus]
MEALEIEFKNLIDYPTYDHLKTTLFENAPLITQTNFYIDTKQFGLKDNHCALRIRDNGYQQVMTLKVPQSVGIMEYSGEIDEQIIDEDLIIQDYIPENILSELEKMAITVNDLHVFGALSTERREIDYKGGLLVLDASFYLDTSDYEIEYEVHDYTEGEKIFNQFLSENKIEVRDTISKVQRFYNHYKYLSSKKL